MPNPEIAEVAGPALERLDELIWIGDIPGRGAAQQPERCAIHFAERGESLSYAELDRRSDAFVAAMQARGLRAGDRIAYLGRNSDLYFPALFGAIRGRYVLVPLNWRLAAPELAYQIEDSQARLVICDPDLAAVTSEALQTLGTPVPVLCTEGAAPAQNLRALLDRPARPIAPAQQAEQPILQLYTSGTTGKAKGVLISHGALSLARHAERISADFAHLDAGCICLSAMPNFHIGGMSWVLMGLVRVGTVVITADPTPANLLQLIRSHRVEHTWAVPTLIRALVDALRADQQPAPPMKGIFYGAMPMDEQLLRESMERFGCAFLQFFGMTENGGSATCLAPRDHDLARPRLLKSVGKPYPGMSLQVRGPDRRVLRRGEHGEIWVRSPTLMLGYWQQPSITAEALVDGWYASGDGGYLDEEGYLFLTDRIKDMIVSGGENVYPIEVEEALRLHPAVLDVAVVGLTDPRWGEVVNAVVELRPGASVSVEDLSQHTRSHIAAFKCPKTYHFGSLPRTASGKVQRALVRQQLQKAAG
jgi:acyl-CoA synthetase (AMP-forming)/AMP-acid ligase II